MRGFSSEAIAEWPKHRWPGLLPCVTDAAGEEGQRQQAEPWHRAPGLERSAHGKLLRPAKTRNPDPQGQASAATSSGREQRSWRQHHHNSAWRRGDGP